MHSQTQSPLTILALFAAQNHVLAHEIASSTALAPSNTGFLCHIFSTIPGDSDAGSGTATMFAPCPTGPASTSFSTVTSTTATESGTYCQFFSNIPAASKNPSHSVSSMYFAACGGGSSTAVARMQAQSIGGVAFEVSAPTSTTSSAAATFTGHGNTNAVKESVLFTAAVVVIGILGTT